MIISVTNPRIKHLKKLLTSKKYRWQTQEYVLETNSPQKIEELHLIKEIYVVEDGLSKQNNNILEISPKIADHLTTTESKINYFVLLKMNLVDDLAKTGKFLLTDNIQDPGNLGTIVRTGVAFGYQTLIINKGTTDPYSPKAVRSSSGYISNLSVTKFDPAQLSSKLLIAADTVGENIQKENSNKNHILILGNEAHGLSPEINKLSIKKITIPIEIESLNVAIAAAIIMYSLSN